MNEFIEFISGGTYSGGVLDLQYQITDPEFIFRIIAFLFVGYLLLAVVNLFGGGSR